MGRFFAKVLFALAGAGLALSSGIHITALLGRPNPFGIAVFGLHAALFCVFGLAVALSRWSLQTRSRGEFRRRALLGCPRWMRFTMNGLIVYGIICLFRTMNSPADLLGFSALWMALYSNAMALMLAYMNTAGRSVGDAG
jgi:hypothetical protein